MAVTDSRIRGAIMLAGSHIEAVAVARPHRRQGLGRALIEAAAAERGQLTAACPRAVSPFYAQVGFALWALPSDRVFGIRAGSDEEGAGSD